MRQFLTLLTVFCLAFTVSPILAGPIADSLAFQGRLTDASDVPVPDGPRDLTISLWTDSVGGTMLHSEVVVVTVSKGLYSTCIGCASSSFFDIFKNQSVYLQVQLAGSPPMTPRTVMRSVPFSVSSSSLHGSTALPGGAVLSAAVSSVSALGGGGGGAAAASYARLGADSDGDGVADFVITDSAKTDGVHSVTGGDLDGDGSPELACDLEVRVDRIEMKLYDDSDALQRNSVTQGASTDSANQMLATDMDGDGVPDVVVASSVRPSHASLAIKTKGTSAQRLSGGTDCDDLSATNYLDSDDDGDGIPEDEIESSVMPGTCSVAIKTKGTGADPNRIISTTTPDSVVTEQTFEFTNSLLMPALMKAKEKANRTKCSNNLRYQSPIANNEAEFAVDSASSGLTMSADSDGDGIPEARLVGKIVAGTFSGGPGTVTLQLADLDDDGIPEGEISETVLPTTSSVAIKTKGTGADANRVISSTTDTSNAVTVHSADIDGDGVEDAVVSTSSGVAEVGGIPGGVIAARVAIKTKGTGADPNRSSVSSSSSPSRSSIVCDQDSDGDGLADRSVTMDCDDTDGGITVARADGEIKIKHKGWDGLIYGRVAIETGGNIEVDFGGNGVGFVSQRFGVGVLSPTHPFEHSSGAHLTAGGVWTNASDENLKENFQAVDGAALLEKLEDLPISQWNYKNESDEVTHIGPTAQDFQKVFGVGENDKTISTIDPSGIALAAIKELNNKLNTQNQTLNQENKQLRKEMDELKKMVQELAKAK